MKSLIVYLLGIGLSSDRMRQVFDKTIEFHTKAKKGQDEAYVVSLME